MKKLLSIFLILVIVCYIFTKQTSAQESPKGSTMSTVEAQVGELYLDISGYISPYANVVLSSNDIFMRSAVADKYGRFYISQVLIKKGFSGFCLYALDFKRIGESTTCFNFPPAQKDIVMHGLFLPPTLGLSRTEIAAGSSVQAFGYTMPGAVVTLKLDNGKILTTTADSNGFYVFKLSGLKAGTYQLFATANYEKKESLAPSKTLTLKALSLWEQLLAFIRELIERIVNFFTSMGLGPLWLCLPIIILIIILIIKIWPEKFGFIFRSKLFVCLPKVSKLKPKKLHDYWWVGY